MKFYQKFLILIFFILGGVLFLVIDGARAKEYSCQCQEADAVFTVYATGDKSAHDICNAECLANGWSKGVQVVWEITTNADCRVNGCLNLGDVCNQDSDGAWSCVSAQQAACPAGCPGGSCQPNVTEDGGWGCVYPDGGTTYSDYCTSQCENNSNVTECIKNCLGENGGSNTNNSGTNNSDFTTGTNNSNFNFVPIGNVILPNPLSCSNFGTCLTNIADFLITLAIPFAVFMIILAGFRFVTAQGAEDKINLAKRNFVWTVLGVAVVLASKLIIIYIQELLGESQGSAFASFFNRIKGTLNLVIIILFSLATCYFIWGVIQYIRSGGDEKMLEQGKKHMIWGVIGMAVMGAAWPIVEMIKNYVT